MKKLIIAAAALSITVPAVAEDTGDGSRILSQEEIEELLDEAREEGYVVRAIDVKEVQSDFGIDSDMVIDPSGEFDLFADAEVHCSESELPGIELGDLPTDKYGKIDPSGLPEDCAILHKLVARLRNQPSPQILRQVPPEITDNGIKNLSEADTLDEPSPGE